MIHSIPPRRQGCEVAPALVAPFKGNPYRVGYFSDNEVGWWGGALFSHFSQKPGNNFTKQRWVSTLQEHYSDWDRLKDDFAAPAGVSSWEELLATTEITQLRPGTRGIDAVGRWTAVVAKHYYAMVERVLREADPEALILGDRLPVYYDPVALKAMRDHVDVISTNYNIDSPDGWLAPYYFDGLRQLSGGKPILISEWFLAAAENHTGNVNNGHLMTVKTQAERALGAAAATTNFAAIPEIVGLHWFQYFDHPLGGRLDGEDYNFGLVDIRDGIYERLTSALAAVHDRIPALHARAHVATRAPQLPHIVPKAKIDVDDHSLADWPKPAALLRSMRAMPGEVAFAEAYLSWSQEGLALATIGQDYYDVDLLAYDAPFPLGEAYRVEVGIDAGEGLRRFTAAFIPPKTRVSDHPVMTPILCMGTANTIADCSTPADARVVFFAADQPRITAEMQLPWHLLGSDGPPPSREMTVEIAISAWHGSRWISLSGLPPQQAMARPEAWQRMLLEEGRAGE